MTKVGLYQDGGARGRKEEKGSVNKSFYRHKTATKVCSCALDRQPEDTISPVLSGGGG